MRLVNLTKKRAFETLWQFRFFIVYRKLDNEDHDGINLDNNHRIFVADLMKHMLPFSIVLNEKLTILELQTFTVPCFLMF